MKGLPQTLAEVDFNRDDDRKEFGLLDRIVSLNYFEEGSEPKLGLTFRLGRKEDDTINLVFNCKELMEKEITAIIEKDWD